MPFAHPSLFARLLANSVESDTYAFEGTPCWEWTGYRIRRGYGRIAIRRPDRDKPQGYAAHRVMAEIVLGRELCPNEETIEHRCEIPWCVNYWHFALASRSDNTADMNARRRGGPRKVFRPLVDPALFYCDPFERGLPIARSTMTEDCPF